MQHSLLTVVPDCTIAMKTLAGLSNLVVTSGQWGEIAQL